MATKHITDLQVCWAYAMAGTARATGAALPDFVPVLLQRVTGQCEKACYRAMERAADRGLVEYGVSLRTGWLTEEGRVLLDAARATAGLPAEPAPLAGEAPIFALQGLLGTLKGPAPDRPPGYLDSHA